MMPRGSNLRMNSASTSCGWSSQYTPASRTRRAMSWVTWEPKSRMRILSMSRSSLDVVVGRFLRDLHVVHVRLAHARRGDLHELRPGAHVLDGAAAGVAHARAHPAHELLDDRGRRSLVGNAALDALGHQLVGVVLRVLEVAVARALLHRADRAHAAVRLVRPALEELDVAGVADAAVGDARLVGGGERLGHVLDRGDLRHAHARDDARRADRAGTDADLDAVGAVVDQRLRGVARRDVAADHLHLREALL